MGILSQTRAIEKELLACLDRGMTSNHEMISAVVEKIGLPPTQRGTVRRAKAGLIKKLKRKVEQLQRLENLEE